MPEVHEILDFRIVFQAPDGVRSMHNVRDRRKMLRSVIASIEKQIEAKINGGLVITAWWPSEVDELDDGWEDLPDEE